MFLQKSLTNYITICILLFLTYFSKCQDSDPKQQTLANLSCHLQIDQEILKSDDQLTGSVLLNCKHTYNEELIINELKDWKYNLTFAPLDFFINGTFTHTNKTKMQANENNNKIQENAANENNKQETYQLTLQFPEYPIPFTYSLNPDITNFTHVQPLNVSSNYSFPKTIKLQRNVNETQFHVASQTDYKINSDLTTSFNVSHKFYNTTTTISLNSISSIKLKSPSQESKVFEMNLNLEYQNKQKLIPYNITKLINKNILYAIKIFSNHKPFLTKSFQDVYPVNCGVNKEPLELHHYIAGEKHFNLMEIQGQFFNKQIPNCKLNLDNSDKVKQLSDMIENDFQIKFLFKQQADKSFKGLPISIKLGQYIKQNNQKDATTTSYMNVFTHFYFKYRIQKSTGMINYVKIEAHEPKKLTKSEYPFKISMKYEGESPISPSDRLKQMNREKEQQLQRDNSTLQLLMIVSLVILIVLLLGLNGILIKTVRKDLLRYKSVKKLESQRIQREQQEDEQSYNIQIGDDADDDEDNEKSISKKSKVEQDEVRKNPFEGSPFSRHHKHIEKLERGWKKISQDALQPPDHQLVLSAAVGAGIQLNFAAFCLVLNGSISDYFLNQRQGVLVERFILFYKVGAFFGGFTSGWLFKKINPSSSRLWIPNLIITSLIFLLPFFIIMIGIWIIERVKFFSYMSDSHKALPFNEVAKQIFWFFCFVLPLTIAGGFIGRKYSNDPLPHRQRIEKQIPSNISCISEPKSLSCMSGIVQFVPMVCFYYYTLLSIWDNEIFNDYFLLLIQYILQILTVITIGMISVYLILNSENHKWWYPAFSIGGAMSFLTFLVSIVLFLSMFLTDENESTGYFNFSLRLVIGFFGYQMIIAWMVYIAMGSIGFLASFQFMTYLYSKVRLD